jgi:hypothetical protein
MRCFNFKVYLFGLILGMVSQTSQATHYEIFIVAGQSNACGRAEVTQKMPFADDVDLPFWYEIDPDYGNSFPHSCSEGWVPLGPQERGETDRFFIGPEIGLGKVLTRLSEPKAEVVLFKFARGGSSLQGDWLRDEENAPRLYSRMLQSFYGKALPALVAPGDSWRVAGFFWMQGESETSSEDAAKNYADVLEGFIHRVRKDFHNPGMIWVMGRISWASEAFQDQVRKAQTSVVMEDDRTIWVDTDDLPRKSATDNHFNVPGQMELGRRMGLAYLYILEQETE